MFKVLKDTPPIPETLSREGKDFLRCCFCRNPAERPSASMLLEHRFMRVSHQPDVSSFIKPVGVIRVKVSTFNSSPLQLFFFLSSVLTMSCDFQCNNITLTGKVKFSKRADNIQSSPRAFIAREVALKKNCQWKGQLDCKETAYANTFMRWTFILLCNWDRPAVHHWSSN